MKIRDILAQGNPTLSFEVFPPKTEDNYHTVEKAAKEIAKLKPAFMSVTYGAGGGTSDYTVGIASDIKGYGVTPLAHLTCVSSTREKVQGVLKELKGHGIENVLALRKRTDPQGLPLCVRTDPGNQTVRGFLHRRCLLSGRPCGICQQVGGHGLPETEGGGWLRFRDHTDVF